MGIHILLTLPRWDDTTEYLSAFSKDVIDHCKKQSVSLTPLSNEKVTRDKFVSMIRKNTKMFMFNGHGTPDYILGHRNEKIISFGENHELLKDKITYSRSCWSFGKLGESCKNEDKGCFIGYLLPFQFIVEKVRISNPLKDKTAKIFFDSSNLVPIGLIKGKSAGDAHRDSKKSILKSISRIVKKEDDEDKAILESLWNNYHSQKIAGNEELTLY